MRKAFVAPWHPEVTRTWLYPLAWACPQHQFQVLTKRAARLAKLAPELPWPPNAWMGVSVENKTFVKRVAHLAKAPAAVRFLSIEPLLGPVGSLPLHSIHWVIVGGESGNGARPMDPEWVRDIRDQWDHVLRDQWDHVPPFIPALVTG